MKGWHAGLAPMTFRKSPPFRWATCRSSGPLQPLAAFTTNPAGSAIVNALGPIRQLEQGERSVQRRYLVIVPGTADQHGAQVRVQMSK